MPFATFVVEVRCDPRLGEPWRERLVLKAPTQRAAMNKAKRLCRQHYPLGSRIYAELIEAEIIEEVLSG